MPAMPAIRPGGLTAICVIAIVLGAMGFMSSGMNGLNLLFGKQLQEMVAGIGGMQNKKMMKAQEEMYDAIWEINDRFIVPSVFLASSQFALAIALMFGGLKTLKLRAIGRKVLLIAVSLVVVFELVQLGLFAMIQLEMMPVMDVYMSRVLEGAPGGGPGGQKAAQTIAKFSMIAGFIMQAGWMLVKLIFLGLAIWYLRSQRIRLLFQDKASSDQPQPAAELT